jgi:hypothetical protein
MLHATLRSLKNSGPLGTHAAVYGLSSLCVTLHPAQSVTTKLQHSPSAVPARRARARADQGRPFAQQILSSPTLARSQIRVSPFTVLASHSRLVGAHRTT